MQTSSFTIVPDSVLMDARLSAHARLVWAVLRHYANGEGECWPSQQRLVEATGLSKPTLRRCVASLEAAGLLEQRHAAHANRYRLVAPEPGAEDGEQMNKTFICTGKNLAPETAVTGKNLSPAKGVTRKILSPADEQNFHPQMKESFIRRTISIELDPKNQIEASSTPLRKGGLSPPEIPEALREFDRILQRTPGYRPNAEFYAKVESRYRHLDLDGEALKIEGWLASPGPRRKGRTANTATILNWLEREAGRVQAGVSARSNDRPRNGQVSRQDGTHEQYLALARQLGQEEE